MPPLPRMKCFASAAGAPATPLAVAGASPLHSRDTSTGNEVHKLRISAAATPPGRLGTANGDFKRTAPASTVPAAETATAAVVPAALSEPGGREKARKRETLEQRWAAWQQENEENKSEQENRGPAPILGKPAPAPAIPGPNRGSLGRSGSVDSAGGGGRGAKKSWGGVGDFHEKVALLGDYVASVFGRSRRGVGGVNVSKAQRSHDGVSGVLQYGVE